MVPAQQRLGGDDRAVGKADLRLIDERELVALDRAAQIDLELRAIGKLVRERLAELFDPAAPMPLRLIHRRVGGAHQLGQRGAVARAQRDAHRRARSEEHTSELQSLMRISYAVFCLQKKKTE